MSDEELSALADKVADRLKAPLESPKVAEYEVIAHSTIEGRMSVMIRTPSDRHYVGQVINWVEVPDPRGPQ